MSDTTASTRFIQITTSVHGNGEIMLYALDEPARCGPSMTRRDSG
jgi:hypothetical protein